MSSTFGDYQDALLGHNATQVSHHTTNHQKLEDVKTKLDTIATNTANIKLTADSVNLNTDELEGKLDTINTTLSSGIGGLPTALTGSGNLKVSLQELGNEGSERLNVDVGTTVSQLPTALTGEGNLKVSIQEDFTHNLSTSAKQDTQITHLSNIDTGIDVLEACCGSDKVNVNISSGNISGFATSAKQDTINSSLGDLATESTLQIISEEFTKCDTDNITITGGLTGSGNLKVCIQELGNEGSERLNVDIGNAVAQLPTALSGSGRLKIENDFVGAVTNAGLTALNSAINSDRVDVNIANGGFDGAVTNTHLSELGTAINSARVDVNIANGGFNGAVTNAGLTALNSAVNSDKVDVNISSGGFNGAITNTHLSELGTAINSAKVDVNISSGGFNGAVTNAGLTALNGAVNSDRVDVNIANGGFNGAVTNAGLTALNGAVNSDRVDVNIANGGFNGAVTNAGLTALNSAINSDKVDVNISSGNITGFSTSANQSTANGHLLALANVVNPAIATATSTTIPNKLDTIETTANAIETKTTLHTTSELKELLSNATINSGALSSEFDFENYRHARFFGITTASVGTDFLVMGTNTSGGTYYVMGENLRSETISSTHYIYSPHIENLPRYIKIINKSGSTNYIFTKLYVQLSEGRVAV